MLSHSLSVCICTIHRRNQIPLELACVFLKKLAGKKENQTWNIKVNKKEKIKLPVDVVVYGF